MTTELLLAYVAIVLLAVLSPGPAIVLALRNGLSYGASSAIWSSLGNIAGLAVLSTAVLFGLGVLLKSSLWVFTVVKVLGAAYLIYLGLRQLRGKRTLFGDSLAAGCVSRMPRRRVLFAEAFVMAVTNPKPILFFTALFPPFIDPAAPLLPQFLILTLILMVMSFLALMGYAMLVSHSRNLFRNNRLLRWVDGLMGSTFIALGVGMLLMRKPLSE